MTFFGTDRHAAGRWALCTPNRTPPDRLVEPDRMVGPARGL